MKAADVKLISVKPWGATGRLVMSGSESMIDSASEAARMVLDKLNEMQATKSGTQLG